MSGYVEAGYVIALGSLGAYALGIVSRERAARRRLLGPAAPAETVPDSSAGADTAGEGS